MSGEVVSLPAYMGHTDAYFTLHGRGSFEPLGRVRFQKADVTTKKSSGEKVQDVFGLELFHIGRTGIRLFHGI